MRVRGEKLTLGVDCELLDVYDGDTFNIRVPSWPPLFGDRMPVRIKGYSAYEIKHRDPAIRQKALVTKRLLEAILRSGKEITIQKIRRGRHFRVIATVLVEGRDIAQIMKDGGHNKPE